MLRMEGITRRFGDQEVVAGLDVDFPAASTTALIGPSGCGKSTMLRLLIGLIAPDAGTVWFQDQPLAGQDPIQYRQRFGYVIQSGGLFPHLTARENILLPVECHHRGDQDAQRLSELAELTRFPQDGLDRYPAQLSGGQRQRVSLMRALILDPDVLLLDEPLGALDPLIRADLQEELAAIFSTLKKTVVLVTHDLYEAGLLGDTILLLNEGKLVQTGTLEELVARPATDFVRRFVRAQHVVSAKEGA